MERKIRLITSQVEQPYYIAEDGTEFPNRWECEKYEREKLLNNYEVIRTAITGLRNFEGDAEATLYNIKDEKDWHALTKLVWFDRQDPKDYPGPGKYIVFRYDGGDYDDSFYVHKAFEYLDNLVKDVIEYKNEILQKLVLDLE